jgi:hypothetical protein
VKPTGPIAEPGVERAEGQAAGVSLFDRQTNAIVFDVNFWHYRAIVEAIRSLGVLPEATVDALHESWQDTGLTTEEARLVATAIRTRLLPMLGDDERLRTAKGCRCRVT